MIAVIGKRAALQVERIDARWRERGDDKTLFVREYLAMLDHLETVPGAGRPWPTKKRPDLKRVLLEKTRVHMYFRVNTEKQEIVIISFLPFAATSNLWGASSRLPRSWVTSASS